MDDALAKIRPHTKSSLAHQKSPANLLCALESTLQEKSTDLTPTAYFAALVTALDRTVQKKETSLGEGDVLPAELYLLALVSPFVPPAVIQANLSTLLSLTAPLFPALVVHAPPLRSQLGLYNVVFRALDRSQLDVPGVRQAFASILQLCLDARPKVRKRAADLIADVLSSPPPPLLCHPYAKRVAEWAQASLEQASAGVLGKAKGAGKGSDAASMAIHLLALLAPVLPGLPHEAIPPIISVLLTLPRLGNPYLTESSYSILSDLLSASVDSGTQSATEQIPAVLSAVVSSPPPKSDLTVAPSWLQLLGATMLAYRSVDELGCEDDFLNIWNAIWAFFESSQEQIREATVESLDALCQCITPSMVQAAIRKPKKAPPLQGIVQQVLNALDSLGYAHAIAQVLSVIPSLILNLDMRIESEKSTTAAEILLMPLVLKVADLRMQKNFEHKEAADNVISTTMRVCGPAVLLQALPLNLEPEDRQAGREPRAFLLPMLSQPHSSPLSHFVSYFVPLSERMFDLQQKAETGGRQSEAKVWSVLVSQVWSGFTGYCYASPDVKNALGTAFSQLLSQLLYNQPNLRVPILKGLKLLVESNLAITSGDDVMESDGEKTIPKRLITQQEAAENVAFLKSQVESWFAVFFNVFSSVEGDSRGIVGDVIRTWASLADGGEISKAYRKVIELFGQNLQKFVGAPNAPQNAAVTTMTQDLLILLLPSLETAEVTSLFHACLTEKVLCCKDNGIQKRGYKLLAKCLSSGKVQVDTLATLQQLDTFVAGLSPAAKKARFVLLSLLVTEIPSTSMHVIPSLIPEAVLGTKEPSEKSRTAAFDLIVAMGRKMSSGGVVKRHMLDDEMDQDVAGEAKASIDEYLTMVAAGLAGASPHMISATITGISRLVFEFKDAISQQVHTDVFTTLLVFLSSTNREIVKSALGYVKLSIHTLPVDLLRPHLDQLVPALLAWSHDHKNHFKVKVQHIFERMIRRFGWDNVYSAAGQEEAGKVLVNIKKRKDRAKRKKARGEEADGGGVEKEVPSGKVMTGDAFEDVLYGSESEYEGTDDDEGDARSVAPKNKAGSYGVRLRADDDEPMDLLRGAASRMTIGRANHRRRPGKEAGRFKVDSESGKVVIPAEESGSDIEASAQRAVKDVGGGAYKESITSVDGFRRNTRGTVKFNKDTKKRRRENEDEDVEMADETEAQTRKQKQRQTVAKVGKEFMAKRGGGDVRKGGLEPYAYVSLGQVAKKKNRIAVTGKR